MQKNNFMYGFFQKLDFGFIPFQKIIQSIALIDEINGKWSVDKKTIEHRLQNLNEKEMSSDNKAFYESLTFIRENFLNLSLSEDVLQQFNKYIFKYSEKDKEFSGIYRNVQKTIAKSFGSNKNYPHFIASKPENIKAELTELITWANRQIQVKNIHPLIVIAAFAYDFLSIHPFNEGNLRTSILIMNMLLLKAGYSFVKYISFMNYFESYKEDFYDSMIDGQQKRGQKEEKIDKWLMFFLKSLEYMSNEFIVKYEKLKTKIKYLNERQYKIIEYIEKRPVKVGDLAKYFSDIANSTLKKDLQYLKKEQFVLFSGKGKGTIYFI